jgi:hypothetical protein
MDELIRLISEKLEVSQDLARKAVLITADYLKNKLPPHIYTDVEAILETSNVTEEETKELGVFRIP